MALGFSVLTETIASPDTSSYVTASVSPTAGNLILLQVTSGLVALAATPSSISGVCSTWNQIQTQSISNGNLKQTIYWGIADSTGTITINFTLTHANCGWRVVEVTGADTTPVVQSTSAQNGNNTPSASLSSAITAGNASVGFVMINSGSTTVAPGSGYTSLGTEQYDTGPSHATDAEYRLDGQQIADFTLGGSFQSVVSAVEIAEAAVSGSPETLYATSLTSGAVSGSANALGAPDGTFTTDTGNTNWTARFAMDDPSGDPAVGTHSITLRVRKESGQGGTPVVDSITLFEGANSLGTVGTGSWSVTSGTGEDIIATFDSSVLSGVNLANVEVEVATTGAGGPPGDRTSVQLDSITWDGDFVTGGISQEIVPATETSASQTISHTKIKTISAVPETNTSVGITSGSTQPIVVAGETETAQPLISSKNRVISPVSEADSSLAINQASTLTADAGLDQTVDTNSEVTLDGSASTGNIASYYWQRYDEIRTPTVGTSITTVADPDTSGTLDEVSGLAVSQKNTSSAGRVFWAHNDSGGAAAVYAVDDQSPHNLLATYSLTGASNQDWEDLALGPGPVPGESYIYVGDIGSGGGSNIEIYRFPEPDVVVNQSEVTDSVSPDVFTCARPTSPDSGLQDCESMFVDPVTGDLFLVRKTGATTRPRTAPVFKVPASELVDGGGAVTPVYVTDIVGQDDSVNDGGITGADITPDGRYIAFQNYEEVWVYKRDVTTGQTVDQALDGTPLHTFVASNIGEATAFDKGDLPSRLYIWNESPGGTSPIRYLDITWDAPEIALSGSGATRTFTAPATADTLEFFLRVEDDGSPNLTDTDRVIITVTSDGTPISFTSESDLSQAVSRVKSKTIGIAGSTGGGTGLYPSSALHPSSSLEPAADGSENTESAQPLSVGKSRSVSTAPETSNAVQIGTQTTIGIASETEVALSTTTSKSLSLGTVVENQESVLLGTVKTVFSGEANESDIALSAQHQNEISAGIALESDSSIQSEISLSTGSASESNVSTISSIILESSIVEEQNTAVVASTTTDSLSGVATELDTALLAQTQQTSQTGVSAETDTVLTASTLTEISSETGVEVDSVPSSSTHQALTSSVSSETDTALSATTEEVITPGTVSETDVVVSASVNVLNNSGPALEIDSALSAMTDADGIVNAGVPVESNTVLASSFEIESEISIESDIALPATVNFEGTEFNAGVASESDVVLQSSLLLQTSFPIAESDSSVGLSYSMTPGTPSETDSVPESSVVIQSGTVTESDSALSTFSSLSINAEVASESDNAVTPKLAVEVATSAETDAALTPLSGGSFNAGIAIETETTPSVLFDFSENAGISVENDSALPSSSGNLVFLGSAVELDQSLFTDLVISSSPTTENDSAIDASTTSNSFAGTSVENEFVPTSSVDQQLQVGPVIESDVAVIPSVMLKLGVSLEQDIALVSISGFIYKTRAIEDHIITVVKKNPPLILIIKDSES